MQTALDHYVITAGDVALNLWFGRAYDAARREWVNVAGTELRTQLPAMPLRVKGIWVTAHHATGQFIAGLRIQLYLLPDPLDGQSVIMLKDSHQSPSRACNWYGDMPLGAGFQWRVAAGDAAAANLVAGDYVDTRLVYNLEHHPGEACSGSGQNELGELRLLAKQRIIIVDEITGLGVANWACLAGHAYVVNCAVGEHNHAAGSDTQWTYTDSLGNVLYSQAAVLATGVLDFLYDRVHSPVPFILRENAAITFAGVAVANGEHLTLTLAVDEYVGENLYLD